MSRSFHSNSPRRKPHTATTPSPLRQTSTISNASSNYSSFSNPFPPTRQSTISSVESEDIQPHFRTPKRAIEETDPPRPIARPDHQYARSESTAATASRFERPSLRPLSQAPNVVIPPNHNMTNRRPVSPERTEDIDPNPGASMSPTSPPSHLKQAYSIGVSRSDSRRMKPAPNGHVPANKIETSDLEKLGKSSTGHFRALSKFAENGEDSDFSIHSPDQEVAGMHGRRRLQRNTSIRGTRSANVGYGGRTWMDQQRQFLQAYEYLCHIGEAKEWIEDVIHKSIPEIVQLEENLRDGVTLAEIVQALQPEKKCRVFRNPRLQFRHSDNIALFFRYLEEVELPDLFRFELVDLYEKKNVPKVIYCIHALSWLLLRKGIVDFRIGNLVGQLEFEHHELEATQKGLDKAGVSMPNFSSMRENFGAEPAPPPEPVETEEERMERELHENEDAVVDLQAQVRGALLRMSLGDVMQELWDGERLLIDFQSRIRGDFARQVSDYRMLMKRFAVNLQSVARGSVVRTRQRKREDVWKDREKDVVLLQSLIRARKPRMDAKYTRSHLQRMEPSVRSLQSAIRGTMLRRDHGDQIEETRAIEPTIIKLQSAMRAVLERKQHSNRHQTVRQTHVQDSVVTLQALVRKAQARQRHDRILGYLDNQQHTWIALQSAIRGQVIRQNLARTRTMLLKSPAIELQSVIRAGKARKQVNHTTSTLQSHGLTTTKLQASCRAAQVRQHHSKTLKELNSCDAQVRQLQSLACASLLRKTFKTDQAALQGRQDGIKLLQSAVRGYTVRSDIYQLLCDFNEHENEIVTMQSCLRAMLVRSDISNILEGLETEEEAIIELQAAARAKMVRGKFEEKKIHYNENMQRVIKVQSFVRARQQGEAYKSLTSGKNPPVNTVKNFVHLLNDSDFDFEEEVEGEKLRKAVGSRIRENEQTEKWIAELDAKIGLLAHNKIARDEYAKIQNHFGGHASTQANNKSMSSRDTFNLKALNKNSRAKLELYQEMFLILQTESQYLPRLFRRLREQGIKEDEHKRLEMLIMSTFGFAQKRREEFYLIKLISASVKEEADRSSGLQDFMRGSYFFGRLFSNYTRAPRDRKYYRDVAGTLIMSQIVDNRALDLESDPLQIYRAAINDEELRTGRRSQRPLDVPREQAIKDPQARETFILHLQDLRDIVDQFLLSLDETLPRLPYGVRYIAQQMYEALKNKFRREDPDVILQTVGNWVWKSYIKPAFSEPERTGAVDRGLDSNQRRNLGQLTNVINQVAAGKYFGDDNVYLQPLNSYMEEAIGRLNEIWAKLIDIPSAQSVFEIDVFDGIHAKSEPVLYIKMNDIVSMHQMIANNLQAICPSHEDNNLRDVVRDLGSAKNNEAELSAGSSEITLTLTGKLHDIEDPDSDVKALFMETKRCVLYIIRVQAGENLMHVMVKPITPDDEARWAMLVEEELTDNAPHRRRRAYTSGSSSNASTTTHAEGSNLADLAAMSYAELKGTALENILAIERRGRLSRTNNYQDLLNEIASDIRQKHKRRQQRRRELENVRATLAALEEKRTWLEEKLKAYNDTLEQNLNVLQNKKGKRRFIMPFSTQWNHERELARLGRTPAYGSYKYSADALAEKGILAEWRGLFSSSVVNSGTGVRSLRDVDVTISSDEVNVFVIEGSVGTLMLPGASATFTWDDLLEAQWQGQRFLRFFGEDAAGGAAGFKGGAGTGGGSVAHESGGSGGSLVGRTGGVKFDDAGTREGGSGDGMGGTDGAAGELVVDAKLFMQQVSKKFWPEG